MEGREAPVDLYFSPLACSMATRIALYEAGADAGFIQADMLTKRLPDGTSFLDVSPLGQVPALRTDSGEVLLENQAILQYVADRFPEAELAPPPGRERTALHQWLSFVATELHKLVLGPMLDPHATPEVLAYCRDKAPARLAVLDRHLTSRDFLLDRFSVADAYLVTILGWTRATGIDLTPYPAVRAYLRRVRARPSVSRALSEEGALFAEYQARQAATRAAS
jgi:glutathione S-transferase